MKIGKRELSHQAKEAASALIAAMDLEQLYGSDVVVDADQETLRDMETIQRELVKRIAP
jgi:hypothetical protein